MSSRAALCGAPGLEPVWVEEKEASPSSVSTSAADTPATSAPTTPRDAPAPAAPAALAPALQHLLARPDAGSTTVMVQNVPSNYTQRMMLKALWEMGFKACIDLFYLPFHYRNKTNMGYAFVNVTSEFEATLLRSKLEGQQLPNSWSRKVLRTELARVQGFKENFESFRHSVVMARHVAPEYQPVIIDPSTQREVAFPPPCEKLRNTKQRPPREARAILPPPGLELAA